MKKKGKYTQRYLVDLIKAIVKDYKHLVDDSKFDVECCVWSDGEWFIVFFFSGKRYPLVTELRRRLADYDVVIKRRKIGVTWEVSIDGTWEYVDVC